MSFKSVTQLEKRLADNEIKRTIRKVCSKYLYKFKIPQKIVILREINFTSSFKGGI